MSFDESNIRSDLSKLIHDYEYYLSSVRTGRANTRPFEEYHIDPYETGSTSPLQAFGSIATDGPLTIIIQPYDSGISDKIVEAINKMAQTYNPINEGTRIRIPIPPLTEERREQIVKEMNLEIENNFKKRLRQVRQNYMQQVEKDEDMSEDRVGAAKKRIQALIDHANSDIERQQGEKEAEIMNIASN